MCDITPAFGNLTRLCLLVPAEPNLKLNALLLANHLILDAIGAKGVDLTVW